MVLMPLLVMMLLILLLLLPCAFLSSSLGRLSPACAGVCLRVLYIRGGLACVFPLPRPGMELVCLRVRVFG